MTEDRPDESSSEHPGEAEPAAGPDRPPSQDETAGLHSYGVEEPHRSPGTAKKFADLDVCPNCGAPMTDPQQLVCLRCGFDLKSLKVVKTRTGVEEVESVDEVHEDVEASFSQGGRGEVYLPLALAAVGGVVLVVGFLAGAPGLFASPVEGQPAAHESFSGRMVGVLRWLMTSAFWTGCALAAAFFTAHLMGRKLGDLKLAAARLGAIIVIAQLARFVHFSSRSFEWIVETIVEVGVFVGLTMLMFRLSPRDAATLAACTVAAVLVVLGGSHLIVWLS